MRAFIITLPLAPVSAEYVLDRSGFIAAAFDGNIDAILAESGTAVKMINRFLLLMYTLAKGFQCVVGWGRRRVGKTTLITEFCKDKECVYFTALATSERENLENLSRAILGGNDGDVTPVFPDYGSALEHLAGKSRKSRIILALDEYPYLAKSWPGISSLLQTLIDQKLKKNRTLYNPVRIVNVLHGKPGIGLSEPPLWQADCPVQDRTA